MTTESIAGGRRSFRGAAFRRATWRWSVGWFIAKVMLIPIAWAIYSAITNHADIWLDIHYFRVR